MIIFYYDDSTINFGDLKQQLMFIEMDLMRIKNNSDKILELKVKPLNPKPVVKEIKRLYNTLKEMEDEELCTPLIIENTKEALDSLEKTLNPYKAIILFHDTLSIIDYIDMNLEKTKEAIERGEQPHDFFMEAYVD